MVLSFVKIIPKIFAKTNGLMYLFFVKIKNKIWLGRDEERPEKYEFCMGIV